MAPATRKLYRLALNEFVHLGAVPSDTVSLERPASTLQVLRFITRLHFKGLSVPSIRSKLSAVAYWHQIHGWSNPTSHFLVRKCLLGVSNTAPPAFPFRGPVTPALLLSILRVVSQVTESPYELCMFRAIFLLAFFAFLRLGEYTDSRHNLSWRDVIVMDRAIKLRFNSFKFSRGQVAEILLPAINSHLCPVEAMLRYGGLRPKHARFCFVDDLGQPLKASVVRQKLQAVTEVLGLPKGYLTPHSFRIGAATAAAAAGVSEERIMRMGRWSSAAFRRYIRCQINSF